MRRKTPLNDIHKDYDGHMIEFAGWDMPLYYTGIIDEHEAVRNGVGIFDVSHMGKIEIRGKDALVNLQRLLVSNIVRISIFQVKYSALCYSDGGIVDDVTVYRIAEDGFLLCANASNTEKDYQWISKNIEGKVEVSNRSPEYVQLAIQGPKSFEVLQKVTSIPLSQIKYYWSVQTSAGEIPTVISRTGYTGEDGFELYFSPKDAVEIWERLMKEGKPFGIKPVGLGARDSLRLEMGFPLYGHELDERHTLLEAGFERNSLDLKWLDKEFPVPIMIFTKRTEK